MAYGTYPELPTLPGTTPTAPGSGINPMMLLALAGMFGGSGAQAPSSQEGAMRQVRPGVSPLPDAVAVPGSGSKPPAGTPPDPMKPGFTGAGIPNILGTIGAALGGPNSWQGRLGAAMASMAQGQQMEQALRAGKSTGQIDPLTLYLMTRGQ